MEQINTLIEKQYHKPKLYEDIVERLEIQGIDLNDVSRDDILGVDEFHVRGAEVSKELAAQVGIKDATVLDIGCGIGGPCRMLVDEFNCNVTGVDIYHEYVRTAQKLSNLVKLNNSLEFVQANALNLPFENETFDFVWTQHAQMNINDKIKFYSEIKRVLTDKGTFIYYDIFKNGDKDVDYPVPWANDPLISFLATTNDIDHLLRQLDFKKVESTDQTEKGIQFFENLLDRINKFGPPVLGLNVLMGESTKTKLVNLLNGLKEKKIVLQSGIYKK